MSLISALGSLGILSFCLKLWADRRERRIDTFHKYAALYSTIIAEIAELGAFERGFQANAAKDRALALRLFFLLSEEKYLADRHLLSRDVWEIWRDGIQKQMGHRYFSEAWVFCRTQCDFEGPFAEMIDNLIQKNTAGAYNLPHAA